jgi:hypothetical protein
VILDRLIAMGSTYFVSGPRLCSRDGSYERAIKRLRKNILEGDFNLITALERKLAVDVQNDGMMWKLP